MRTQNYAPPIIKLLIQFSMKKLFVFLLAITFMAVGCKTSKQAEYTILGDYTPYGGFIEKMNGQVQNVTEKLYWTVADADTFKKGDPVTIKERDSLKWYYDYEANFDSLDNLLKCDYLNENGKIIGSWQFFLENNKPSTATWTWKDTVREDQKLTCNEKGIIVGVKGYKPHSDSLLYSMTIDYYKAGDTVLYLGYNSRDSLDWKVLNLYNEKGQFISYESYDKKGAFTGSDKVVYNDKGKMSEVTFFDKDKKPARFTRTYSEYDSQDNWTKAITRDTVGHIVLSERTYNYFR
jgi:hypothetical protein